MKIIIIGAGISGLATYHALRKYAPSVQLQIYEAHASPTEATCLLGGGLGLAPNGQRALNTISPSAVKYLQERGFECEEFVFRNQKGRKLGRMRWGGRQRHGFGEMMIARANVHESLLIGVEDGVVQWGRKVKHVREMENYAEVMFEDGAVEMCDLVIGADGAWSKCREAIFGQEYQPEYDGLTGIGGFLPLTSLPPAFQEGLKTEPVTMTFSRSGFFGYSMCTSPSLPVEEQFIQWWSTYETSTPLSRDTPPQEIRTQLLNRHGMWKSPHDTPGSALGVFLQMINLACDQTIKADDRRKMLILPRFMTPRLPYWTSLHGVSVDGHGPAEDSTGQGRIILVGDARSTMPPDSGQGVSCAVEDALTLALVLKHFVGPRVTDDALKKELAEGVEKELTPVNDAEALKKVAKAYEDIRMPRLRKILRFAKRGSDGKREIGFFEERMRNFVLFIMSYCIPESIHDSAFAYNAEVAVDRYLAKQEWRW